MLSAAVVCLALTIYHEGRGESLLGQIAIAQSVLNRTAIHQKDVCSIVKQGGPNRLYRCQYTWYCDRRSDKPLNHDAWIKSLTISRLTLGGLVGLSAIHGATCYYAPKRRNKPPPWARPETFRGQIGGHRFYVC